MQFRSAVDFQAFAGEVSLQRRYIRSSVTENFLKALLASAETRAEFLAKGHRLFRARLGHSDRREPLNDSLLIPGYLPYEGDEMKPPFTRAAEGRANPKGIPVLYLATEAETALMEVRPWVGSHISLAEFEVRRDLRVINCAVTGIWDRAFLAEGALEDPSKFADIIWNDIDLAFSTPVERSDDHASYAATQIVAELFLANGYDGIIYRSLFGANGLNVVLFGVADANFVKSDLTYITGMSCKWRTRTDIPSAVKQDPGRASLDQE